MDETAKYTHFLDYDLTKVSVGHASSYPATRAAAACKLVGEGKIQRTCEIQGTTTQHVLVDDRMPRLYRFRDIVLACSGGTARTFKTVSGAVGKFLRDAEVGYRHPDRISERIESRKTQPMVSLETEREVKFNR